MHAQTTKLRICVASSGLGHVMRGVEAWAGDLGETLANRGEQVILCKGAGDAAEPYERIVSCWTRNSTATRRLLKCIPNAIGWRIGIGSPYGVEQFTFAVNLLSILHHEQIDVLHLQDPQLAILIQQAQRVGLCSAKMVFSHATEEPPELLNKFSFVQHLAPWHQHQAVAAGIGNAHWTTIPDFVDTTQFHPDTNPTLRQDLAIPQDAHVALVSSAIKKKHKRVDYLIDEVATVLRRRPDLPLWLVIAGGREQDTNELVAIAKAKLGDRVRFAIQYPRNQMGELYQMADVFLHGSLFEMFGLVLLEATASGLPCLFHHHPVMQWVVGPGGIPLDTTVNGTLANTLIDLLDDQPRLEQMKAAARAHCVQHFGRDVVVDQILQYYQQVVGQSKVAA
ncbi:glycosyltransferase family 4 protein [Novipirellula herctigrandis]